MTKSKVLGRGKAWKWKKEPKLEKRGSIGETLERNLQDKHLGRNAEHLRRVSVYVQADFFRIGSTRHAPRACRDRKKMKHPYLPFIGPAKHLPEFGQFQRQWFQSGNSSILRLLLCLAQATVRLPFV